MDYMDEMDKIRFARAAADSPPMGLLKRRARVRPVRVRGRLGRARRFQWLRVSPRRRLRRVWVRGLGGAAVRLSASESGLLFSSDRLLAVCDRRRGWTWSGR